VTGVQTCALPILKTFSETILSFIRKGDYLARFGGEEFVIVLPETPLKTAVDIAHRLQAKINSLVFQTPAMEPLKVTASYGISALSEDDDMETLISEADTMLYLAKTSGRNCVMPQVANFEIKAAAM
jgi:diguanylate cyclase